MIEIPRMFIIMRACTICTDPDIRPVGARYSEERVEKLVDYLSKRHGKRYKYWYNWVAYR